MKKSTEGIGEHYLQNQKRIKIWLELSVLNIKRNKHQVFVGLVMKKRFIQTYLETKC